MLRGFVGVWELASSYLVLQLVLTEHFSHSPASALVSRSDHVSINSHLNYVKLSICSTGTLSIDACP